MRMKKFITTAFGIVLALGSTLTAKEVPWTETFDSSAAVSKYTSVYYHSSNSKKFQYSGGSLYMTQGYNNAARHNEGIIFFAEDGFSLDSSKSYKFEFDVRHNSDTNAGYRKMEFRLYKKGTTTPTFDSTDYTVVYTNDNKYGYDWATYSFFFEPEATGEYYLGLYYYADYAGRASYWDNFKLTEGSMDAPDAPAVTATADAGGVLKANLTVTAPTKTIRGETLTGIDKMVLYRDGGEIHVYDNPTPGQVFTLTDYAAQPGEHTFSAIAHNDKGPGQQADVKVAIGGTVQKQTYMSGNSYGIYYPYSAIYVPGGKVMIKFPRNANVENYQIKRGSHVLTGTPELSADEIYYTLTDEDIDFGSEAMGVQYEVLRLNDDNSTKSLGYTNYLCVNNTIPYYPSFNTTTSLDAYTLDTDYAQYAWQANQSNAYISGQVRNKSDGTLEHNWLISPGLKLSKDKFYRVKITSCGDTDGISYDISAGLSNQRDSLRLVVAEGIPTVKGDNSMSTFATNEMFLKVPSDGMHFIGIKPNKPINAYSGSLRLKNFDIIEVDPTLPNVPTDVAVHYSATGGNDAKITFKAPMVSIDGNPVTGLTKIEIYKDGTLFHTITEGVTAGAEFEVPITVTAGEQNVYTIMAFNAAGQGEAASAKALVLSIPYSNDFNNKNSLEGYTLFNNAGVANEWHLQNNMARVFTSDAGQDHWMITPPITLQAGYYYPISLIAKTREDKYARLDVMLGKAPTEEAMTIAVMDSLILDTGSNIYQGFKEEYFTVPENGQYYLGFHAIGKEGRGNNTEIYLDDLSIKSSVMGTTASRGKLEVIPASDGSLKAEVRYTAPMTALNGTDLNANSTQDVYFYINGVQTPANRSYKAYPGQTIAITVEVSEDLPYLFSAKMGVNGPLTYQDAFIGINTPLYPENVQLKETHPYGHVVMTWDPVTTDIEGYPLYPDLLTYDVARIEFRTYQGETYIEEVPILSGIKGTSCEFDAVTPDAEQTTQMFVIRARNMKGKGSSGKLTEYINVGRPYHIPYQESFAKEGTAGATTAINTTSESWSHWGFMGDGFESGINSADNDGYYIALESLFIDSYGTLSTGKVNLGVATRPSLTFMLYNHTAEASNDENTVAVKVYTLADNKWHTVTEPKPVYELCNNKPGWNKVNIDLSDYNDQVIICGLDVVCKNKTFTSFDNIRIWEQPEYDMSFKSHNAPMSVNPGNEFRVDVNVINNGIHKDKPESVEMYVDGEKVTESPVDEIEPDGVGTATLTHSFESVDMALSHELQFKVVYANDNDDSDNMSAPHTIMLVETNLAPVENISASSNDQGYVTLTWDEPSMAETGPKTETFEDWTPGVAGRFGWTAYDADKRTIKGINDGTGNALVIPGLPAFEPASWAVVDNTGKLGASSFPAKSGNKFLMSIVPTGDSGSADDWMITPELSGNAQTLKFWAKNFNNYIAGVEVMTSDGDMHPDSFNSAAIGPVSNNDWVEMSVELPAGTKRAAIRNISYSSESFMLMVDDVTFEPAVTKIDDLKGYKVYHEAELVSENEPSNKNYMTDAPLENGRYTYAVAAKYSKGESRVVPVTVTVDVSGVSSAIAEGVHVFGGEGCIHITGAEGMMVAVCNLEGIVIASDVMTDNSQIAAAAGIYLVNVNGKTYKVLVK